MTEHKYTDEKVIRALERCVEGTSEACHVCTFGINPPYPVCKTMVEKLALDLINRQKAQIAFWMDAAANAKKEAVKEFAEKLKKQCLFDRGYEILQEGTIDHLVKEFTEEKT